MEMDSISAERFSAAELVEESFEKKVQGDRERSLHPIFCTEKESCSSLRNRHIKPLMSRPPDRVKGEFKGGCDDERGKYVEGVISFEWDKNENSNQKGDPDNSGHDIGSKDKD